MFSDRIVLLARDLEAASQIRELVGQCNPFHELQTVDVGEAGKLKEFQDSLKSGKPDVVLVEVRGFQEIAEVLEPMLAADPMLPALIYCRKIDTHAYLELHRLGFGNRIIHLPCRREILEQAMLELRSKHDRPLAPAAELSPVISFLPGKPGSGASTLAWHFANACGEILQEKVALVDLDLNCGVQSLFGGVQTGMNLFDAISIVDHTGQMPDAHNIPRRNGVDILGALRRCHSSRIDTRLFENFLAAARASSRLVVVDHSGNWERFSVEAMKASAVIYCVSGSDYLSLTLSSRASSLVEEEGLLSRTRLVLNRCTSRYSATPAEAERLTGFRMAAGLPNSYGEMQRAVARGQLVERQTAYYAGVESLALDTLRSLRLLGDEEAGRLARRHGTGGWLRSLGLARRPGPSLTPEAAGRR